MPHKLNTKYSLKYFANPAMQCTPFGVIIAVVDQKIMGYFFDVFNDLLHAIQRNVEHTYVHFQP